MNTNNIFINSKRLNGHHHSYQNSSIPSSSEECAERILQAHSMNRKRILYFSFLLFLTVTILVPFFAIHFETINIYHDQNNPLWNQLTRQQQNIRAVQPSVLVGKEEAQRKIFGVETPQLHEKKLLLVHEDNIHYYDYIHKSNGKHESYQDIRITEFSTFVRYTSSHILQNGCSLTTLVMDPRIPMANFTEPIWFTLESIATYASYSCVVLQTSSCQLLKTMPTQIQQKKQIWNQEAYVAQEIYNRAMPQFRRMMERGQVRITVLNHSKYGLTSCSNFFNPSRALMNVHYWQDEFLDGVDSDMILVMQDDSVLCHALNVTLWTDLAYVGALWAPKENPLWLVPKMGMCKTISMYWRSWTVRYKKLDPNILMCKPGYGPVGNGGLSLRSKSWMIRAIQACPFPPYSGILRGAVPGSIGCQVTRNINEDVYFATVLNGIKAPMPLAYEASLFTTEMLWPEQADEFFGPYTNQSKYDIVTKRWGEGNDGLLKYQRMQNEETYNSISSLQRQDLRTVPIGLHKPWWYHPNQILQGSQILQECKFLKYMFDPDKESRWDSAMADIKKREKIEEDRRKRTEQVRYKPPLSSKEISGKNKGETKTLFSFSKLSLTVLYFLS
jgi:hypothetical protein